MSAFIYLVCVFLLLRCARHSSLHVNITDVTICCILHRKKNTFHFGFQTKWNEEEKNDKMVFRFLKNLRYRTKWRWWQFIFPYCYVQIPPHSTHTYKDRLCESREPSRCFHLPFAASKLHFVQFHYLLIWANTKQKFILNATMAER